MQDMIDIETFSTQENAAIVQIGAQAFDLETGNMSHQGLQVTVSLQSCILHGLHIDWNTVDWWSQQHPEAQESIPNDARTLREALNYLFEYHLETCEQPEAPVWANGTHFDISILNYAYRACGLAPPWKYNAPRDYRTVIKIAQSLGWSYLDLGEIQHRALDDCQMQIVQLHDAMKFIRGYKV